MNSNPRGAVLVRTKPALASKTPMYGSGATVACAHRCSSIALQVAFARFLISAQTKVNTVQTLTPWALLAVSAVFNYISQRTD